MFFAPPFIEIQESFIVFSSISSVFADGYFGFFLLHVLIFNHNPIPQPKMQLSFVSHKPKMSKIRDPLFLMGTSLLLDGFQILKWAASNWMREEADYLASFWVWV